MLTYYFNKGIPDEEWLISPGRKGQSVEYYPHFQERDHEVKGLFDYYADVFYYKLFSAWDNLGHLLNAQYELKLQKPSFASALDRLKNKNVDLYTKLKAIQDSPDFAEMRDFRHSVTHNELLGHIGRMIGRPSQGAFTLGTGGYTQSAKIRDNAVKSLDLFADTVTVLREESGN